MPVAGVTGCEGPFDGFEVNTLLDIWICINVFVVVIVYEFESLNFVKNGKNDCR
jgi:hypothetical protein